MPKRILPKKPASLLLLALIGAYGCDGASSGDFDVAAEHRLSAQKTITAKAGDILIVDLAGNGSTGSWWYWDVEESSRVRMIDEATEPTGTADGAPARYRVRFEALKPGETTITFRNYRGWEGEASATSTNVYRVRIG